MCLWSTQKKKKNVSTDMAGIVRHKEHKGVLKLASFATEVEQSQRGNPDCRFLVVSSRRSERDLSSSASAPEVCCFFSDWEFRCSSVGTHRQFRSGALVRSSCGSQEESLPEREEGSHRLDTRVHRRRKKVCVCTHVEEKGSWKVVIAGDLVGTEDIRRTIADFLRDRKSPSQRKP